MTLLALDTFRKKVGYSPFHFFGLSHPKYAPLTSQCNTLVAEYAWQSKDQASRSDIRQAIADAEGQLRQELGFSIGPEYIERERHAWTGGALVLGRGKVRALGSRQETLIDTAAVTLVDRDGDGLKETFRIVLPTIETGTDDVMVKAGDHEIRPIAAAWADDTLTIEGPIWLIVKPELYARPATQPIDPTVATNFLETLAVYRVATESDLTATFLHHGTTLATQPRVRWHVQDAEQGIIGLHQSCGSIAAYCGVYPTHVEINYLAGDNLSEWATVVTRFALAEMSRRLCDDGNRELARWQRDMTSNNSDPALFQLRIGDASNSFGTRAGHLQAWAKVAARKRQLGVAI